MEIDEAMYIKKKSDFNKIELKYPFQNLLIKSWFRLYNIDIFINEIWNKKKIIVKKLTTRRSKKIELTYIIRTGRDKRENCLAFIEKCLK